MILPLSIPSVDYAKSISSTIWRLSRPDAGNRQTQYYCGWVTHPVSGAVGLALSKDDTQPIHKDSEPIITAFVDGLRSLVPADEADTLQVSLMASRGSRINVIEMLPNTLTSLLITNPQEITSWYPESEL